ncbi:MAG: universal stress protein, partial [Kiloniellales bacterium]|nr:universal stress protein [Kiloniellales bacterium]
MRFSNILLVHDPDISHSLAWSRAITLARNEHATLTICHVVDAIPPMVLRTITAVTPGEMMDTVVARRFVQIERAIDSANAKDLSIEIKVLVGRPEIEIARLVEENRHDLVIKPIYGRRDRAIERADRRLLRMCPCPVWLVGGGSETEDGPILAALDRPGANGEGAELNEHILEVSRSVALAEFRRLHVVHAWHLTGESHLRARGTPASELELDRMILQEEARLMGWLRQTVYAAKSESQRIATDFLAPNL